MDTKRKMDIALIRSKVSEASLYEQLAEEFAELAQAFLKLNRYRVGDNPTPLAEDVIRNDIVEELSDVVNVCQVIGIITAESFDVNLNSERKMFDTKNGINALASRCMHIGYECLGVARTNRYLDNSNVRDEINTDIVDHIQYPVELKHSINLFIKVLIKYGFSYNPDIVETKTRRWIDRLSE